MRGVIKPARQALRELDTGPVAADILPGCAPADPPAEQVQHVTFVPFLPDGRCVLIEWPEGPGLPRR
jgi:hypothetical protein